MSGEAGERSRTSVLDASALLALLHSEPGADLVAELMASAVISTVNWSEVVQKVIDRRTSPAGLRQELEALGLAILPFTADHAEAAALLRSRTRHAGLSLGDRACLALAAALDLPAVTVDKVWKDLALGVDVRIAR